MSPQRLEEIIRGKEAKARDYRYFDGYWRLLIVVDFIDPAQEQDPASRWAIVDAVVCKADTDPGGIATYNLTRALKLAEGFRGLPESCAMRDGRKWKSIPFVIISEPDYFCYAGGISRLNVAVLQRSPDREHLLLRSRG